MKKIVMLFLAGMLLASVEGFASQYDLRFGPPPTDIDIPITGGGDNDGDGNGNGGGNGQPGNLPQPTSAVDAVEARYLGSESMLELCFNQEIGRVTIVLTDLVTGHALLSYGCNTAYESEVYLPVSLPEGSYQLTVVGTAYSGFGLFVL